ncbi:hypothetical protein IFU00_22635 [Oxalobacteraceae sp. CFBP 8761]|nr:hypothetical protein [Oxalobacteraceae sp. CFBP 8761]
MAELDETKAQHFEALMTNERASQYLVELTLGNLEVITANNVEDIFVEAQRRAAETVTKERDAFYGEKIDELTLQIEAGESRANLLQQKVNEIALESSTKDMQTAALRAESTILQNELGSQKNSMERQEFELAAVRQRVDEVTEVASVAIADNEARKKRAIDFATRHAQSRVFLLRFIGAAILWIVGLSLGLLDKFYIPTISSGNQAVANLILVGAQAVLGLAGISLFVDKFVGKPVEKLRSRLYIEKLTDLGY